MQYLLIKIFTEADDFCQKLANYITATQISDKPSKKLCISPSKTLTLSEIMTIIIFFHLSRYRTFKHYYTEYVSVNLRKYFPNLVSYNRFLELMTESLIPITLYMKNNRVGKCTGISFIDSTTLDVCHVKRVHQHKVFECMADWGKSSTGWFFGFKLHIVVNDRGDILSFSLTPGNVDDRNEDVVKHLTKNLFGKLFGDRGYISQKLFEKLLENNVKLVTKIKRNMKNKLMLTEEKILLRKRAIIETINDQLKNICQIEHTRHRSIYNFAVNVISGLIAYSFLPKKPSLRFYRDQLPIVQ